jgi:predicted PhzF superfamily epimerase YddE/YHI9
LLGESPRHPLAAARRGDWLLLELASAKQVREAQPDLIALVNGGHGHLILTAKSDSAESDIVSRVFAPGAGIPEDPVTGFAHTLLAPYWQDRLGQVDAAGGAVNRSQLRCYQASRRGGSLRAKCVGDRVVLEGEAVLAFEAELAGAAALGA